MNKILFALTALIVCNQVECGELLFIKNITKCSMFSTSCSINFLLKDLKEINNLKVKSTNERLVKVKSIDSCSNSSNYQKCATLEDFESLNNLERNQFLNNIYLVDLDPILVGKVKIEFNLANSTYLHTMIITQPKRVIDLIQQIYIIIFSLTTAIIMGILLDLDKLRKILKMPIPVKL